ncbi:MAG: methylated-DNA--[protein]-cysteine S-methyltransferase [Propionicimonas sp.]
MKTLVIDSPIGPLRLRAENGHLVAVDFSPFTELPEAPQSLAADATADAVDDDDATAGVLTSAADQLRAYFAGALTSFALPLAPAGTDFQQRVWRELQRIDYGQTASYGEVARRLGLSAAASRAVGLANSRNPIPIVIPCHRVIGSTGALTGYAGGIARKRTLLELERPSLIPTGPTESPLSDPAAPSIAGEPAI